MKVVGVSAMFENPKIEQQSTRLTRDEKMQKQKRKGAYRVTQREDTTRE
jgi:hypothetical protein